MADLKREMESCADLLKNAWTGLQSIGSISLPRACYEHWTKRAAMHTVLSGTLPLFDARQVAWDVVGGVASASSVINAESNIVRHGQLEMDFSVARHLALTSYVSVQWAIYDRLANVCGRLGAISDLAENPKQNPKACEDLLALGKSKETLGFATHMHIKQAYQWPLRVSYKIRNWLVHEGYEENSTPMFKSERIADGFLLHDDAVQSLQRYNNYTSDGGKIEGSCLTAAEEYWSSKDLLTILPQYQTEVDEMFESLVKWSVESFVGQIKTFSRRDRRTTGGMVMGGSARVVATEPGTGGQPEIQTE